MRVAVFRTMEDGERTARQLKTRGHEALLAPVLDVVRTGAEPPPGRYHGVIVTSAHGIAALSPKALAALTTLPCFCVGARTALLASGAGFTDVRSARADAHRLCGLLCDAFPTPATLLLVAGRDRKPTVEALLGAVGHRVVVAEVYAAEALKGWAGPVIAAFRDGQVEAALHYSQRSAALAAEAARAADVLPTFTRLAHHCLSADAAAPLEVLGAATIIIAAEMDEERLLDSLG